MFEDPVSKRCVHSNDTTPGGVIATFPREVIDKMLHFATGDREIDSRHVKTLKVERMDRCDNTVYRLTFFLDDHDLIVLYAKNRYGSREEIHSKVLELNRAVPYMVMPLFEEYCNLIITSDYQITPHAGRTLLEVAEDGELSLELAFDTGKALGELLVNNIVHGDLKSAHVRARRNKTTGELEVVFIDFSNSRIAKTGSDSRFPVGLDDVQEIAWILKEACLHQERINPDAPVVFEILSEYVRGLASVGIDLDAYKRPLSCSFTSIGIELTRKDRHVLDAINIDGVGIDSTNIEEWRHRFRRVTSLLEIAYEKLWCQSIDSALRANRCALQLASTKPRLPNSLIEDLQRKVGLLEGALDPVDKLHDINSFKQVLRVFHIGDYEFQRYKIHMINKLDSDLTVVVIDNISDIKKAISSAGSCFFVVLDSNNKLLCACKGGFIHEIQYCMHELIKTTNGDQAFVELVRWALNDLADFWKDAMGFAKSYRNKVPRERLYRRLGARYNIDRFLDNNGRVRELIVRNTDKKNLKRF